MENTVRSLAAQMNTEFAEHFRKIWVQYAQIGKKEPRYSLVITVFTCNDYRMIFSGELKVVNEKVVRALIQGYLENS